MVCVFEKLCSPSQHITRFYHPYHGSRSWSSSTLLLISSFYYVIKCVEWARCVFRWQIFYPDITMLSKSKPDLIVKVNPSVDVSIECNNVSYSVLKGFISSKSMGSEVSVSGQAFGILSLSLCVCLYHGYCQTPWPIAMIFCLNAPHF